MNHDNDIRIFNEIEHAKYLLKNGPGDIWNWETPAGKLRWKRRAEMLTSNISKGMNVLEIGCGTGYFTKILAKMDISITAIDISEALINEARKDINSSNVVFKVDNAYNLSFDSNSYDFVVASSVLHHLDLEKALLELYRVLKPEGIIKFTEPNMLNPQIIIQKCVPFIKRKMGDSPDETAFVRWKLKNKLKKAGFSEIIIKPFDFLHPKLPKMFIPIFDKGTYILEKISLIKEISGSLFIQAKKSKCSI